VNIEVEFLSSRVELCVVIRPKGNLEHSSKLGSGESGFYLDARFNDLRS